VTGGPAPPLRSGPLTPFPLLQHQDLPSEPCTCRHKCDTQNSLVGDTMLFWRVKVMKHGVEIVIIEFIFNALLANCHLAELAATTGGPSWS
jgi:hypothetical protein